jgi:hypothetical protein
MTEVKEADIVVTEVDPDQPVVYDLFSALAEVDDGEIIRRGNQSFTEMLNAVMATRGKGTLKIEVHAVPHKIGENNEVVNFGIVADVKVVIPKAKPSAAIVYAWPNGRVSQHNPKQQWLDLKR